MMTMIILTAQRGSEELQVLVCEDEFNDAGCKPGDFFLSDIKKTAKVAGRIECEGDTEWLSGSYERT